MLFKQILEKKTELEMEISFRIEKDPENEALKEWRDKAKELFSGAFNA